LLLTIEKLIYGGDGLARLPEAALAEQVHKRGKAVFVPFVLGGEKIEASLVEQKPGFARANVEAIIGRSPNRVEPSCRYFGRCGGCHYQHASYEHQLEIKKEILRETLRRTAKLELTCEIHAHGSPPWNYRNRSRLQVQTSPEFAAGYFKSASHELLPVEDCPISSPLINRAISALWHSGRAGRVPAGVREVEFFANAEDTELLVDVICEAEARRAAVRDWVEELRAQNPEIAGLTARRELPNKGQHAQEKLLSIGAGFLTYQTEHGAYRVSARSFFQTNRHLIDSLVKIVTEGRSGELALDLYAGVGLFSTALACDFRHIVSVESSQTSSADLAHNRTPNGEAYQATTEQYLARAESSGQAGKRAVLPHFLQKPDLVVADPPRCGLGERVARSIANLGAPRVVYVSCDPTTLARDLAPALGAGYHIDQAHLVDLFPQTYHLESVVHLVK
jgi:23S rRNA (uracil1939-C5)-methyltransferase